MATSHSAQPIDGSRPKDSDERDVILLQQVIEKLVHSGQRVGVTPEKMISLLDLGISIHDLLGLPVTLSLKFVEAK